LTELQHISIIGSGKVATHLGHALYTQGLRIGQVLSRDHTHAQTLAKTLEAEAVQHWAELDLGSIDLLLIAVNDQSIPEVAQAIQRVLPEREPLVVHTSGTSPLQWLSDRLPRSGIFYPLQSFSPGRSPDFASIPLCIEAGHPADEALLLHLGQRISQRVQVTSAADRRSLHLAAVFVNNFVNYLYHIGAELLAEKDLPFALLWPLIAETAAKIQQQSPQAMQTGPALRGDAATIAQHLAALEDKPEWQDLYRRFSGLIGSFSQGN
jgi:predicted short-subunit dehydrogenase-like oxidoreductase (DUF2520 family)